MTNVQWSPYIKVTEDESYDNTASYFIDNGHYGLTSFEIANKEYRKAQNTMISDENQKPYNYDMAQTYDTLKKEDFVQESTNYVYDQILLALYDPHIFTDLTTNKAGIWMYTDRWIILPAREDNIFKFKIDITGKFESGYTEKGLYDGAWVPFHTITDEGMQTNSWDINLIVNTNEQNQSKKLSDYDHYFRDADENNFWFSRYGISEHMPECEKYYGVWNAEKITQGLKIINHDRNMGSRCAITGIKIDVNSGYDDTIKTLQSKKSKTYADVFRDNKYLTIKW